MSTPVHAVPGRSSLARSPSYQAPILTFDPLPEAYCYRCRHLTVHLHAPGPWRCATCGHVAGQPLAHPLRIRHTRLVPHGSQPAPP